MNNRTVKVNNAGIIWGSKIFINITQRPAPSIIAASDKLLGIDLKLDLNQKMLKGIDKPIWGKISDKCPR